MTQEVKALLSVAVVRAIPLAIIFGIYVLLDNVMDGFPQLIANVVLLVLFWKFAMPLQPMLYRLYTLSPLADPKTSCCLRTGPEAPQSEGEGEKWMSFSGMWSAPVWGLVNKLIGTAPFAVGKAVVSVDQYAPVLRAALLSLPQGRANADEMESWNTEALADYVRAQSDAWEATNAKRLELEQIQPEPRLAAVHREAVKLLRVGITMMNASNGALVAAIQGDFAKRDKLQKEADSWAPVWGSVAGKLSKELERAQAEQPSLYRMLRLEGIGWAGA